MHPTRRLTEVSLLDGSAKSDWQAWQIAKARWIEEGPGGAIGAYENSRNEIAAHINRGIIYVVVSDDKQRVVVTVNPSKHDQNYLHAFPEGSSRDRIMDLPTYP